MICKVWLIDGVRKGLQLNRLFAVMIYLPAMTDGQGKNYQALLLNLADNTKISYPVTPETGQVATQGLTEMSGVLAPLDTVLQPVKEALLDRAVEFAQLFFRKIADFNRPGQALASIP